MGTTVGTLTASVLLVLAALVSATYAGPALEPRAPLGEQAESPDREPTGAEPGSERESREPPLDQQPEPGDPSPVSLSLVVGVLLVALGVVLVAVAVAAGLRFVRRRSDLTGEMGSRGPPLPVPEPVAEDDPEAALARGVDAALDQLAEGQARNAIVAVWLRLEQLAGAARFPLHPSDTPTEFAERVCATLGLDRVSMRRLAGLYREARFSTHPLTPAQAETARQCLERLRADLSEEIR